MNIKGTKAIHGVEWNPHSPPPEAGTTKRDRVTVEGATRAEVVAAASTRANAGRSARMQQLEAAIKAGHYRPDAGQLADQLLDAAEVDARLRAMLKG